MAGLNSGQIPAGLLGHPAGEPAGRQPVDRIPVRQKEIIAGQCNANQHGTGDEVTHRSSRRRKAEYPLSPLPRCRDKDVAFGFDGQALRTRQTLEHNLDLALRVDAVQDVLSEKLGAVT